MKIETILAELQLTKGDAVRHVEHIPAREARFADVEPPLPAPASAASIDRTEPAPPASENPATPSPDDSAPPGSLATAEVLYTQGEYAEAIQVLEEIVRAAREGAADLIMMTTEGRHGVLDALRGTVTEQVLRQA